MIIGCLTGNGKRSPIAGSYAYCAPGLTLPLAPDLAPDRAPGSGPFAFAEGALTDGVAGSGVAWRAATVTQAGVDVVIRMEARSFVDRVIVRQEGAGQGVPAGAPLVRPAAGNIEAAGHVESEGLSGVEVYALSDGSADLALVGRAGGRGPEVYPRGPIVVSVGVETDALVVRLLSFQRNIRLSALEVWGAAPGEPVVYPIPAHVERLPGAPFVLAPAFPGSDRECRRSVFP